MKLGNSVNNKMYSIDFLRSVYFEIKENSSDELSDILDNSINMSLSSRVVILLDLIVKKTKKSIL